MTSQTVFKYELDAEEAPQHRMMPRGAQILDVQVQPGNGLCLWALVDTDQPQERRSFVMRGTGEMIKGDVGKYLATIQGMAQNGEGDVRVLVWHIFEINPPRSKLS